MENIMIWNFKKEFENIKKVEDVKKKYRELCKLTHPDMEGKEEEFKNMNKYYLNRLKELDGEESEDKKHRYKYNEDLESEIINKINKVFQNTIGININIYIVGFWIWIEGETYKCNSVLKSLGFKYPGHRKKWYYEVIKSRYTKGDFNSIASKYGLFEVKRETINKEIETFI